MAASNPPCYVKAGVEDLKQLWIRTRAWCQLYFYNKHNEEKKLFLIFPTWRLILFFKPNVDMTPTHRSSYAYSNAGMLQHNCTEVQWPEQPSFWDSGSFLNFIPQKVIFTATHTPTHVQYTVTPVKESAWPVPVFVNMCIFRLSHISPLQLMR